MGILSWGSIILSVLRIVEWLIETGQQHKWIREGEERQIAAASVKVLEKQEYAREMLASVRGFTDEQLTDGLRDIVSGLPPAPPGER
jgi:hypothetical protein